jgi:hypothetical protein
LFNNPREVPASKITQGVVEHLVALSFELVIANVVCPSGRGNGFAQLHDLPELTVPGI